MIPRKRLKPFHRKWQSKLKITTDFIFFPLECHLDANISAETEKTFSKQNDFELDYIFYSQRLPFPIGEISINRILKCYS